MSRCTDELPTPPDTILRFLATERLLHWAIAIPFLGCLTSAAVLVAVYNFDPTRPYRHIFAWMHRGCAAGLILCPSLVLLASVRRLRIHLYNIRQGWVWTFDDIKWLVLMGPATIFKRITLPDQGKFNAAEKLNFMMVMSFSPLFIATGVLIWFPEITRVDVFFPWIVHCGLAALALPLVLGHMIMATINPGTRVGLMGMVTGFVSREWAAHHYARWFREQFPDLAVAHASENTHDARVTAEAGADTRFWPQTATPDLPFEAAQPSPALVAHAPLGSAALGEPIALAPAAGSVLFFPRSPASMTPYQTHPQPAAGASAAAEPPHGAITRAAEHELDRLGQAYVLAGTMTDTVAGSQEPGFAVDGAEEAPALNDGRTAPDALYGVDQQE